MKSTQEKIEKYLKERKWDKNEPVDLSKSIIIEGAELLELFQWNPKKRVAVLKDKKLLADIQGELADIFIYAFGMAISLGLDTETLVLGKLDQVIKKYPVKEIKKGQKQYLKIKKAYRKNHA